MITHTVHIHIKDTTTLTSPQFIAIERGVTRKTRLTRKVKKYLNNRHKEISLISST
jgi:hypothetical protein